MKVYRNLVSSILFLAIALTATAAFGAEGIVNINRAAEDQLTLLPRVGPALAARIIEFREQNGNFKQPEDLMLVRGIGEKTFELMKPHVAVSGETTLKEKVRTTRPSSETRSED